MSFFSSDRVADALNFATGAVQTVNAVIPVFTPTAPGTSTADDFSLDGLSNILGQLNSAFGHKPAPPPAVGGKQLASDVAPRAEASDSGTPSWVYYAAAGAGGLVLVMLFVSLVGRRR